MHNRNRGRHDAGGVAAIRDANPGLSLLSMHVLLARVWVPASCCDPMKRTLVSDVFVVDVMAGD